MRLNNSIIKNAKTDDKPIKLFDGQGLYLQVSKNGSKWWRFKYRFSGKEKLLSLGVYPDVSLKKARDRRHEMRQLLVDSIDTNRTHCPPGYPSAEHPASTKADYWQ